MPRLMVNTRCYCQHCNSMDVSFHWHAMKLNMLSLSCVYRSVFCIQLADTVGTTISMEVACLVC